MSTLDVIIVLVILAIVTSVWGVVRKRRKNSRQYPGSGSGRSVPPRRRH